MKLSHEEIGQILSIVEASSFKTIEITVGDVSVVASKSDPLDGTRTAPLRAKPTAPAQAAAPAATPEEPVAPASDSPGEEGLLKVVAPIVGTFYVAPEPGAAPFVNVGNLIDEDTTIGIIEVMKVFNNVRAEKKGTVVRRLVDDGDFVEFNQPVLLVRPEA